ncbi:MAG: LysM peptidoglycan-binding domain-containing protein [Ardenticatenaceae bacterium]|nr:LysM peptidoglycan-binding domain-containing protein [Anaerolineales bacterium]MCB8982481.1 LysM peptidoglycan-binding domain-containing protein [Ardenticatenaceae bacterium]
MAETRGKLTAAVIYDTALGETSGVSCMFNPFEYTVSKTNTYTERAATGSNTTPMEFSKSSGQTLQLALVFDTYETGEDVTITTNKLWKLMEPKAAQSSDKKPEPPEVAFKWGVFQFEAVITQMTQKFTMFKHDGTPVRAQVNVTFTQYKNANNYPSQNPTSGGAEDVRQVWSVVRGDRLDLIAARVYGDATKWRLIAQYNGILKPMNLRPGQQLVIPRLQ